MLSTGGTLGEEGGVSRCNNILDQLVVLKKEWFLICSGVGLLAGFADNSRVMRSLASASKLLGKLNSFARIFKQMP